MENRTEKTSFILLGLTNAPEFRAPLFIIISLIYFTNVIGNLGMIVLVPLDSRLHTSMYCFLANLSLIDIFYYSAVAPTVLAGLHVGNIFVTYSACVAQMFSFSAFVITEDLLLAAMAYDRYAAVCKPLHYTTIMTPIVCICLTMACYIGGFLNSSIHTEDTFRLFFCGSYSVHHFFCVVPAAITLSCSDRHVSEMVLIYGAGFIICSALLLILISYAFIFITIFKMRSAAGYQKAMSTCVSHFITVSIFYGTVIFMYLQPSSSHSMDTDTVPVFYTMVIPMLDPVVYSLRNKEVKSALKKFVEKGKCSLGF
ncbi:olfactory receptor 5B3-like [Grammomys surdaster]|uniref:olfactory receptor 5B3-like n=1 Tax=Grammomys surdaster TaxID=491861 RepID=UPI0010A0547F|nr:olfactory receptor 5B3-like [Grammomys surdaster]